MKGFFVVFEGVDGSGKGTIIKEAVGFLVASGVPRERILVTAEPTGGYYGKKVRELLKSSVDASVNAKSFLDLYVADRKEHVEKEILPALQAGKIILCDRYKYSTFVYQPIHGIPLQNIFDLHKGMPVPGLVLVLDAPPEIALKRIERRKVKERFEERGFQEKVRQGFLNLKSLFPGEKIFVVDASRGIAEVKKTVFELLSRELPAN